MPLLKIFFDILCWLVYQSTIPAMMVHDNHTKVSEAYSNKHLTNGYVGLLEVSSLDWGWLASIAPGVSQPPSERAG